MLTMQESCWDAIEVKSESNSVLLSCLDDIETTIVLVMIIFDLVSSNVTALEAALTA